MTKGTIHPIGARVRLKSGGPEMLVVDLDTERSTRIAAWKDGAAVSEHEFKVEMLEGLITA